MYLWRKLAGRLWLASHETALRALVGDQLVMIERPNRIRFELEVASKSQSRAQKLRREFGGHIEKMPRDWRQRFLRQQKAKPLKVGRRLIILNVGGTSASRLKAGRAQSRHQGRSHIVIPAGAAFGTGEHATTAMCLRLLERVIECSGAHARRMRFPELVVDLGTGSGILALAASRLGARRVVAIDSDPLAISTAKENARRNKIDNVRFELGDVRHWKVPRKLDIVTANLFNELLIELLPKLRNVSRLILSGILREQEPEVTRALHRNKIDILDVRRRRKWVAILAGQLRRS